MGGCSEHGTRVPKVRVRPSIRASAGIRQRRAAASGVDGGSSVSKERSQKKGTSGKSISEWSAGGSSAFQAAEAVFKKESASQKACENKSHRERPPPAQLRRETVKLRVPRAGKVVHRGWGRGPSSRRVCDGDARGPRERRCRNDGKEEFFLNCLCSVLPGRAPRRKIQPRCAVLDRAGRLPRIRVN